MTCDRCGAPCQDRLCSPCETEQAAEETHGSTVDEHEERTQLECGICGANVDNLPKHLADDHDETRAQAAITEFGGGRR